MLFLQPFFAFSLRKREEPNFSLYAVIDECLLWGHRDTIELFPNWDKSRAAEFRSLRAKGAFLVDAACDKGRVTYVRVTSERGGELKMRNPWRRARDQRGHIYDDQIVRVEMSAGTTIELVEC